MPLLLARREELRGGRCLVVSQAEQGRAQISRVPSDSGVAGTLRGAAGKRDADIISGQLDVWKWTPGRGGCGELGFSRTIINGSCI